MGNVREECLAQGDAYLIKSCVGRPQIPFISLARKHAEKVAHKPRGVGLEERSKRDGNQNRNPCEHKKKINAVDRHHPFFPPEQLSQFL